MAPANTPDTVVRKVNAEVAQILREPSVVARLLEVGGVPAPGTPEEFGDFIASEVVKWRKVIQDAGIRLD